MTTTKPALPEPAAYLQIGTEGSLNEGECIARTYLPEHYDKTWWRFEPLYTRAAIDAAMAEARAVLIKAAAAFRLYEQLHLAKGTAAESTTKAATNAELAGICEATLSAIPSPTPPAEPVETVPWPVVTRYSGGASHEGIGGRVWVRLADDGPEVEYVPAPPARVAMSVTDEMVSRFLGWPLPRDFYPDCGISFDGRKDDEWNKNKTWPTGTNLLTAIQARQMLEHVLGVAHGDME